MNREIEMVDERREVVHVSERSRERKGRAALALALAVYK